jgi:hypothetical protein
MRRYIGQMRKLNVLGRLEPQLSQRTVAEIRGQKKKLRALRVAYNGCEWKRGIKAFVELEATVFGELAKKGLVKSELKEVVLDADAILAGLAKGERWSRMFHRVRLMKIKAIVQALRDQEQLRNKQGGPGGQYPLSGEAKERFVKEIKPVLDEQLDKQTQE